MERIDLDLTKLLGFKTVARNDGTVALRSAKIGSKGCAAYDDTQVAAPAEKPLSRAR